MKALSWLWDAAWAAGKTILLVGGCLLCLAGLALYRAAEGREKS